MVVMKRQQPTTISKKTYMKLRVGEIENSLDEAYKTIADQENSNYKATFKI